MTDINEITRPVKRSRRMSHEPKRASKISLALQLMQRREGATIAQLVAATGWLPHTLRAALTGLKKKGHEVTSSKADGQERVYRVVAP